jgi:hypothetical protein
MRLLIARQPNDNVEFLINSQVSHNDDRANSSSRSSASATVEGGSGIGAQKTNLSVYERTVKSRFELFTKFIVEHAML